MPLPGNGTRAGSVPLDALDAEEIADLLGCAAAVAGAWPATRPPRAPAPASPGTGRTWQACTPRSPSPPPTWTTRSPSTPASCTPDPGHPPGGRGTARTHLENSTEEKGTRVSPRPRHYRLLCLMTDGNGPPRDPKRIRQQAPATAQDAGKTGTRSISPERHQMPGSAEPRDKPGSTTSDSARKRFRINTRNRTGKNPAHKISDTLLPVDFRPGRRSATSSPAGIPPG